MIEHANILYLPSFNIIGGTEQFVYEVAKKYHKYDIAVVTRGGDPKQLARLRKYVPVYKITTEDRIKCKKLFTNWDTEILQQLEASGETTQIIHAMYKTQGIKPNLDPKIDKYAGVSEIACEEYQELTGKQTELIRNPLTLTEADQEDVLFLISATRLTSEKGRDRMIQLINHLDQTGRKWLWFIFTNDTRVIQHKNIAFMQPRLDIRPYIKMIKGRGYGVQLSDAEGDCYFTRECEAFGVPLLVTPLPSFKEQGLIDGKNCYYLPFDMNIADKIDRIVNNIPEYKPYIREDKWEDILEHEPSKYTIGGEYMKAEIKCIAPFYDLVEKLDRAVDDTWIASAERAEHLVELGLVEITKTIEKETAKLKPKTKKATK